MFRNGLIDTIERLIFHWQLITGEAGTIYGLDRIAFDGDDCTLEMLNRATSEVDIEKCKIHNNWQN